MFSTDHLKDHPHVAEELHSKGWSFSLTGDEITQFQVLGERASGTNFLDFLLRKNTHLASTDGLGWKHGFPTMVAIPRNMLVVGVVRDPQSWALSMHKRPWHCHPDMQALDFSTFVRSKWRTVMDRRGHFPTLHRDLAPRMQRLQLDSHPITGQEFSNIFELRTAKLCALAGFLNRGCSVMFAKMESVISDPKRLLDEIDSELKLDPRSHDLVLPGRRLGNRFKRHGQVNVETPQKMSFEDVSFLNGALQPDVEHFFGYRREL